MRSELVSWKAKIDDIIRAFDKKSTAEKQKVSSEINNLHMLVQDLEDRITALEKECPTDWTSFKGEIDDKITHLQSRIGDFFKESGHWG